MYNDFVLVGPKTDPAKVKGSQGHRRALQAIKRQRRRSSRAATAAARIVAELRLWKVAGIDIAKDKGPWYATRARAWDRAQHARPA